MLTFSREVPFIPSFIPLSVRLCGRPHALVGDTDVLRVRIRYKCYPVVRTKHPGKNRGERD